MLYENTITVLYVDLSSRTTRVEKRADLIDYFGGVGVAARLLEENMKPELEPLDEQQPAVFAIGALSSVYPAITKTAAMFISPLTGELGESYAGGRLTLALFMAGYDAVVLTGRYSHPCYLSITEQGVAYRDARPLWGMLSEEVWQMVHDNEPPASNRSIMRIGPAGENKVAYASVNVDNYRHFGRLGLGAVLGSKNVKAITVTGDRDIPIPTANLEEYFRVYCSIFEKVTGTDIMKKYRGLGTAAYVLPLDAMGAFPTKNLASGRFESAEAISAEAFAEKNLVRKMACAGCPVDCIHVGQFRREFKKEGYEYEAVHTNYDYELVFALGSYLGLKTTDEILMLTDAVEETGMDAMSSGVALGWATEAFQKGLLSTGDTLVPLAFGDTENYVKAVWYIAGAANEFYSLLGRGCYHAAQVYGGQDFAMTMAKNEMSGYHTGYGILVGSVVGARHSHLCNGGYELDRDHQQLTSREMVEGLLKEEKERCMINSMIICLFSRRVYDRPTIIAAGRAVGFDLDDAFLTRIGQRIFQTKMRIRDKLGFDLKQVQLPRRFFETPGLHGVLKEKVAKEMIDLYAALVAEEMKGSGSAG
ncbi:putative oxidoreductase YdhV [Pelotomaculum sp. FP]|uniref:aldehyde ferredoxin oxidoreductase N-terminal domain-containing protein n=1 Tax=Pelotomaculum sp. FP TaxID=261474 RepID=UPI0010664593|nr:aldehyde ferredoxin oxidoreductase C-terminal domain-containing protein [Pelotomaculum sp. FP]TEB16716.1 putative oxidoreductase YdhV [Pelotomaculum sp. FP]